MPSTLIGFAIVRTLDRSAFAENVYMGVTVQGIAKVIIEQWYLFRLQCHVCLNKVVNSVHFVCITDAIFAFAFL